MIYTQEEKVKMDAVLQAFQTYVDDREDYDVLYSRKAGYLRVLVGEDCDPIHFPITGFADMVRMFTEDFLSDENHTGTCLNPDFDLVRSWLAPYLDQLGDHRQEAYGVMEQAFQDCRTRCVQFRQDRMEQIQQLESMARDLRASLLPAEGENGI